LLWRLQLAPSLIKLNLGPPRHNRQYPKTPPSSRPDASSTPHSVRMARIEDKANMIDPRDMPTREWPHMYHPRRHSHSDEREGGYLKINIAGGMDRQHADGEATRTDHLPQTLQHQRSAWAERPFSTPQADHRNFSSQLATCSSKLLAPPRSASSAAAATMPSESPRKSTRGPNSSRSGAK
jgi:hypothetical protein